MRLRFRGWFGVQRLRLSLTWRILTGSMLDILLLRQIIYDGANVAVLREQYARAEAEKEKSGKDDNYNSPKPWCSVV